MKVKGELTGLENFGYYFIVIMTLGAYWFLKVVIKKAIIEGMK